MIVSKQISHSMFVVLLSLICTIEGHARVEIGGLCYNLDNTNLTAEVSNDSRDIIKNNPEITTIAIPATIKYNGNTYVVTQIGPCAFEQCENIKNVTIPTSVTKIGDGAFYRCYSLQNINIPKSVTEIGKLAFDGCSMLTSINIPNSIRELYEDQFAGCTSLTTVIIPSSVTKLCAFSGCSNLTSITIPDSVIELGGFAECSNLTSITIPNSVRKILRDAFYNCEALTSITIPDSVTEIEEFAFYGCTNLTSLTVLNPNIKIADKAFYNCKSLTSVNLPKNSTIDVSKCFWGIAFNREQVIKKIKSGGRITPKDCNGNPELLKYYSIGTWKGNNNDGFTVTFTVKADGSFTGTVTLTQSYTRYSQYTGRVTKFYDRVSGTISGICYISVGEICFRIQSRRINSTYSTINGVRVSTEDYPIDKWKVFSFGIYTPNYTKGHNQILDTNCNYYFYRISSNRGGSRNKKK